MSKWSKRAARAVARICNGNQSLRQFAEANLAAVASALEGKGPDASLPDPHAGVRAVVNIPSVHVPSFCERSKAGHLPAYFNGYDLERAQLRIGDPPPDGTWKTREIVDNALTNIHGHAMNEVYFAAAELNGTGIRFYGDVCLVLAPDQLTDTTQVLDRNSYDVMRAPFRTAVEHLPGQRRQAGRRFILASLAGTAKDDLKTMGAVKVLVTTGERDRRLSTGQISGGVLDDEDYIEVLKIGSFSTNNLESARLSAAEVALENHAAQRLRARPTSSHVTRLWLRDRRSAVLALGERGVEISVVSSPGRIRS